MEIIDGKLLSSKIKDELKEEIELIKEKYNDVPGLVAILVGDDPPSKIYVNSKAKSCEEVGMKSKVEILPATTTETELIQLIKKYNQDDDYNGILVQLPLPKHLNESRIINEIIPSKDVDGIHPNSVGNLVIGNDTFIPCTPAGIQEMIRRYKIETKGKHLVVVGRSNIVGKPIANLMFQKKEFANSIVTICHSAAPDISAFTKQADILVVAIGVPNFIKGDMIKDGAVVIDVGINRVEDKTAKRGYRVVGDVDFESVSGKASFITPVPGGVGLMTISMLLKNTLKSFVLSRG